MGTAPRSMNLESLIRFLSKPYLDYSKPVIKGGAIPIILYCVRGRWGVSSRYQAMRERPNAFLYPKGPVQAICFPTEYPPSTFYYIPYYHYPSILQWELSTGVNLYILISMPNPSNQKPNPEQVLQECKDI